MPRYAGRCLLAVRAGAPCARSPSFPGVHRAPAPLSAAAVAVRFRTSSVLAYPCLAMPIVVLLLAGAACGLLGPYKLYMVVCFCDLLGGQVPLPTAELLSSRPCFVLEQVT
ncbi:uncharacterized protein LOC109703806 [Ananas comosus]|uniref:Uncharacterized protein LOC109703806 n=1 Tax=Ananas comosus TaxID=4615 RepID=A0A6P5EA56_ANACO|nr:uncharacterized protein LOC109703806 [Ananas comosus]